MDAERSEIVRLADASVVVDRAGVEALAGVDVRVDTGERVGLLGASGSGKTTLIDVLAGLRSLDRGSVSVFGVDPGDVPRAERRRHGRRIGTIGQHLDLTPSLRVVHNVNAGRLGTMSTTAALWSLVRPAWRDEVERALSLVGLADRIDAVTHDLSGGERQRVAVARVLHQAPDLVLADEPTSSVDPELSDLVLDRLVDAAPTVIVSLHDPELARRHVDRVIGLRSGRVVLDRAVGDLDDDAIDDLYRGRSWT
ncbi:MAG: ATP-binding cassette domain-containing protein [Actinomycetota bacterium]